jgi:hypothetical protein
MARTNLSEEEPAASGDYSDWGTEKWRSRREPFLGEKVL